MPRRFPLAAVLNLRQQKEEAEERVLGAITAKILDVRTALERVETELVRHRTARAAEVAGLQSAAHHVANENRWKMLGETRANLLSGLKQLEMQRSEQMKRYLTARSDREMLTELRAKQHDAWNAQLSARDAKRIADLFAARRHRD